MGFDGDTSRYLTARRLLLSAVVWLCTLIFIDTALASNAAVGLSDSRDTLSIPQWLYIATGGAAIGASALLASIVTDRALIDTVHDWQTSVSTRATARMVATTVARIVGLIGLVIVLYRGFLGPQIPTANVALIVVFVGVRAGLTMVVYLFGNIWPALNPWRTIATFLSESLPTIALRYPERLSRWPAVLGLLFLIWIETVTPVNNQPALLAGAILVYTVITIAGAVLFSPSTWFTNVDPISVAFRFYGQVSPLRWSDSGLTFRPPGFELVESDFVSETADIAFIIALVWELTFSGFVTTTSGVAVVKSIGAIGIPPLALYVLIFVVGYLVFLGAYFTAAPVARRAGETYLTPRTLAIRFAASLLAIAAGYHLAHYFGFFVSLSPLLVSALTTPFSPPANPLVLSLPGWFGMLPIMFVLVGHMLAVWVAHADAFATFPSRIQAIRSQYPFVLVMISYTVISLWLISLPTANPAFVS